MKLIILRGLPGCGKSTIAEKLKERLNIPVVFGDTFKRNFMKQNSNSENEDVFQYAYDKIFKKIKELFEIGEEIVIVEELFNDKDLIQQIQSFCKEKDIEVKSFLIKRDLEKLLEVEEGRERKIKNTKEDFENLRKELEDVNIENEIVVNNNGVIEDSVYFVLEKI